MRMRDELRVPSGRIIERCKRHNTKYKHIEPITILERDKWVCQLCLATLDRDKRGTLYGDAPEIDHIIPLAKGGQHIESNLQVLCRNCNIAKSDKIFSA